MNSRKTMLGVESLESRTLPSGSPWGGWGAFFNPSPAVQADLAKIQTDGQKLHTDLVSLAPTLQADQQAVQTAITAAIANDASVKTAEATLKADAATWGTKLQADWHAVWVATSWTARSTAFSQFLTDASAAATALKADHAAVHTAIQADAAVQTAEAKLKTDSAPIAADQAVLQADFVQLKKDLHG